ncbi:MAG: M16 family metallopeptidase [Burkholderiaceae bacterium]
MGAGYSSPKWLLGLLAIGIGAYAADPAPAAPSDFTLKNGLRVIVKEDHRSPTVAHMVWYRAGSVDEVNGTTGVAHVLEHMMFKGTAKLKPGEFSRRVAALGGRENAFTSRDYTAYFQQVQSKDLLTVMGLEADRMANLRLSKEEFDKEIRVVMEERRWRTDDKPQALLYEALMAQALVASPYRVPVIGWMGDLQSMTYLDAQHWYQTWYAPNNAVLIVAGDVRPQQVRQWAEQTYGKIAAKPFLPARKPQAEPAQRGARRLSLKAPAENPYVMMSYPVPVLRDVEEDVDPYALSILAAVLDGYDNARFARSIVKADRIADQAGAGYDMTARGPGLFLLDGTPAQGKQPAEVEAALLAQIRKVAAEGVSESELQRVKAQLISAQIYKRDSLFGQAMEIAQYEMVGISYRQIERIIAKLRAVTAAQVQAVAGRYFADDQATVATLVPLPITQKPAERPKGLSHE